MLSAFHHVSLLTKNRAANLAFYQEILGLRLIKQTVNQENTRMRHDYFGDNHGSPGSVITFFPVPRLGHRYDRDCFMSTIGFRLPKNSLSFWQDHLTAHEIYFTETDGKLIFSDPDDVTLVLTEVDAPPLAKELQVTSSPVPGEKQVLGLQSAEIHVPDVAATSLFFAELLNWPTNGNLIPLQDQQFLRLVPTTTLEKSHMGRGSIDHLAFSVPDETTLDQLHQKAQKQGWHIEKIITRGYFKSLYIREPGGNRMEFATVTPGFTIDEPLAELGTSFVLPPFLAEQQAQILADLYPDD